MSDQAIAMPQELIGVVADENVTRFDRAVPDAHFSLPAHPTVKQQIDYASITESNRDEVLIYERLWKAAQRLILEWDCSVLPDRKVDITKITSPQAAEVIKWVGTETWSHIQNLEKIPKV